MSKKTTNLPLVSVALWQLAALLCVGIQCRIAMGTGMRYESFGRYLDEHNERAGLLLRAYSIFLFL